MDFKEETSLVFKEQREVVLWAVVGQGGFLDLKNVIFLVSWQLEQLTWLYFYKMGMIIVL